MKKQKCEACKFGCPMVNDFACQCPCHAVPSQVERCGMPMGTRKKFNCMEPEPCPIHKIDYEVGKAEDTQPTGEWEIGEHAIKQGVRMIIQDEIAREVWYESRQNEHKLLKCLENAELKLTEHIQRLLLSSHEKVIKEIGARFYGQTRIDWKDLEAHLKSNLK